MDLVFCYLYMAVCCCKQPHSNQDLLGYQTLIVDASLEYQGDGWMGYDRQFHQGAATNATLFWAQFWKWIYKKG